MRIKFSVNLCGIEKIRGAFTFGCSCFGPCVEDTGSILYLLYINLDAKAQSADRDRVLTLSPLLTAIQTQYEQSHRLIC